MKTLNDIREILIDNLSSSTYSEVTDELIVELLNCDSDCVWTILNDDLSSCAIDELEYETDGLQELKDYLSNN